MLLKKKGLLSDCEQMLCPMSADKEGYLRGGFGGISVASVNAINDSTCINLKCANSGCTNNKCGNGECTNRDCLNTECFNITKESTATTTQKPSGGKVFPCGLL